ncbi:MAG: transporter ATP-binding protein [Frankiales bacterium]|nr:transporter ATP-binding protein [Frankiales bacterium]
MSALLKVEGVRLVREGAVLLDDVDMEVRDGERWALLGPNGAGKTTLLSLAAATRHPTSGRVEVLGQQLGRVDVRDLWPSVGHVLGRFRPSGRPTVRTLVLTGATGTTALPLRWVPPASTVARVAQLMAALGVDALADRTWDTLSNGEQRRALIARALVPDPPLLLLDEPAAGLDLPAREQLVDALDVLAAQQPDRASVLVTHHLEELPGSTTHALLLRDGRVVAGGPVEQVLTQELLSEAFRLPLRVAREDGRWSARSVRRG